jgi:plastocyanin
MKIAALARAIVAGVTVMATIAAAWPLRDAGGSARAAARAQQPHLYHAVIGVNVFYPSLTVEKFVPDSLVIHAGDSVQWTNVITNSPQTVTFGPILVTPPLVVTSTVSEVNPLVVRPQGGHIINDVENVVYSSGALMGTMRGLPTTYTFTFPKVGLYLYRSLFHPSMLGQIQVVAARAPASPDPPDSGPSMFAALKSVAGALDRAQPVERTAVATGSNVEIEVGAGDGAISLEKFIPAGVTVHVGTTIRWYTKETSGDLHALVFGAPTDAEQSGTAPLYTGLTADGGMAINGDYATPSLPSATQITTATFAQANNLYTSGIIYGSDINYPSLTPASYTLTFQAPGQYYYVDPFHAGMLGLINVVS